MPITDLFGIREILFKDILDILIIWFVIYQLFRFMSGTRTKQMAFGLVALFFAQILAEWFELHALSKTIGSLFSIIPVAIIVLFQREIRRVLASIGSNPFSSRTIRTSALDNIFNAALGLAKNETGALIVLEGEQGLRDYIESGTRIDAIPSTELLIDIFQPKSNLHDGAVIIAESRLASAACLMPLSRNSSLPRKYGTRHRAAIGISEETDAIALVVSEETGVISFTQNGEIYPVPEQNISKLYETYNSLMMPESREKIEILRSIKTQFAAIKGEDTDRINRDAILGGGQDSKSTKRSKRKREKEEAVS